ncbi:MAG TPA: amidohydrolase family protein [Bryobacteraceae bacterium]|nr:amidohydrolase family protein [Bryobacteraceae bacterium]
MPREDVSVSIADGRIAAIGKDITPVPGARVIDATGKFLIPGLWDMHVHLDASGSALPRLVENGITGIREMYSGIPIATLASWRVRPDVPRIVIAGFLDGPLLLTGGPLPRDAFAIENAEEARIAVASLAGAGADFLKVYNSLTRDAYFAIAQESKRLGIPFAGHVPEAVSPAEASEAGQHSQEHLINILLACSTREEELRRDRIAIMNDPEISGYDRMLQLGFPNPEGLFDTYDEAKAAALFKTFVKNGTWHTPTLAMLRGFLADRAAARRMPYLQSLTQEQFEAWMLRFSALLERHKKLVGDMHRAGVDFLAGTDMGPNTPVVPGASLHHELELLVESGLSPMEALQSATRNPARYLGKLADMGTIEPGKLADLVLLEANPLEDIRNTRKVRLVVLRGRII